MDANQKNKKSRYPGIRSFEPEEQELFFGRSKEISELFSLIKVERFAVLFSKSGIGKTSLINAGINPLLEEDIFYPIKVRFQNTSISPINMLQKVVAIHIKEDSLENLVQATLNEFAHDPSNPSLWEYFKACSFQQIDELAVPILMLDQFEEFFLHKEEEQQELVELLADIMYERVPSQAYKVIRKTPRANRTEKHNKWVQPLNWKVLFAIRSDRLSFLDKMSDDIPAILNNRFHLLALNKAQAEEAIIAPAKMTGQEFITPPFHYSAEALQLILGNLSNEKGEIESFQLQIICGHLETQVIKFQIKEITAQYIGGAKGILQILNNYYESHITDLALEEDQALARKLIEEGLIVDSVRVSLAERIIINQYKISPELLLKIEQTRIIKPEETPLGKAYEVSHDTLVKPILESYEKRRIKEARLFAKKEQQRLEVEATKQKQKKVEEAKKRRKARFIASLVLGMTIIILVIFKSQTDLKITFEALKEKDKIALEALGKAKNALTKYEVEHAEKDQLNFDNLKARVIIILEANLCATELIKEMETIASKATKKEALYREIKSLNEKNTKCK